MAIKKSGSCHIPFAENKCSSYTETKTEPKNTTQEGFQTPYQCSQTDHHGQSLLFSIARVSPPRPRWPSPSPHRRRWTRTRFPAEPPHRCRFSSLQLLSLERQKKGGRLNKLFLLKYVASLSADLPPVGRWLVRDLRVKSDAMQVELFLLD